LRGKVRRDFDRLLDALRPALERGDCSKVEWADAGARSSRPSS